MKLSVTVLITIFFATMQFARADNDPYPLWKSADWDHVRSANNATTKHLSLFLQARDARRYCPANDHVVRLDRRSGMYYYSDQPAYDLRKPGYYVCEHQARVIGARAAIHEPCPSAHSAKKSNRIRRNFSLLK